MAGTPCQEELEYYYILIMGAPSEQVAAMISYVNCAIQELEVLASGGCSTSLPFALSNFDDVDSELLAWIHSATDDLYDALDNPVCGMIAAGYTEEEIEAYLSFLHISLTDVPDPGYDNDNIPDPYSAYNISTTPYNSNKVTEFLIDYPCVKPFDNLGLLLSKPEVVDWAIGFLDGDCGDESKTEYTNGVFNLLKLDDTFVPERFTELYTLLENGNDNVFISECDDDITQWIDLASFVIPSEVNDRIISLGWTNQDIEQGNSKNVNLDYHSVTIDQLPDINGDGVATPEELVDEVRLNFPNYADGQTTVEIAGPDFDVAFTWSFFQNDYEDFWNTDSPEKSIMEIDTESNPDGFASSWWASGLTDDATVICSSYDNGYCWVFSTIWTSQFGNSNNGSHPVSGNRQFGLKLLENGKYEFYIKAADRARINPVVSGLAWLTLNDATDVFFAITDATWNNLTSNISSIVNDNSGVAIQNPPITVRPDWVDVIAKLKSASPLTSISCE